MKDRMDNKVVVITGGASGMGAAMATDFIQRGAKVAVFDLDSKKAALLEQSIGSQSFAYYQIDVTNKAAIETATQKVEQQFGKLTSWVNSAGVSKMVPFLESSEALWDKTIAVNLKATFLCCQVAKIGRAHV